VSYRSGTRLCLHFNVRLIRIEEMRGEYAGVVRDYHECKLGAIIENQGNS